MCVCMMCPSCKLRYGSGQAPESWQACHRVAVWRVGLRSIELDS